MREGVSSSSPDFYLHQPYNMANFANKQRTRVDMFLEQHTQLVYADAFYNAGITTLEDLHLFNSNLKENLQIDGRLNNIVNASFPVHFLRLRDCLNRNLKEGKHGYVGLKDMASGSSLRLPRRLTKPRLSKLRIRIRS